MSKIFEGYLIKRKPVSKIVTPDDINNRNPITVSNNMMKKLKLEHGLRMKVKYKEMKGKKVVEEILEICGQDPELYFERKQLNDLTVVNPEEKFAFDKSESTSLRVIDRFAPVGKGSRSLIVAPPRAGKTTLLKELATEITCKHPEILTIALLVDERPEEITDFRRNTDATVFASSNDQSIGAHVFITSLAMAIAKNELECGNDVVFLVDSLTRIGRVYNLNHKGKGKVMSGGVSAGALDIPRRFFGMARNIEEGGSLTIMATILVDTGSRMDQLIFEEFKGTGNCDIILDREIADNRVFPAINILQSGTRRDELFYDFDEFEEINSLRRKLLQLDKISAIKKAIEQVK
jgi:transcription termination factor Rho